MRLGDLLVRRGVLTEAQRDAVLEHQRMTGRPFGELAERLFGVGQSAVEEAWAEQYALIARRVDPRSERLDPAALTLLDRRQAWQFRMLPLRFEADELLICTTQDHLPRALKFAGWKIQAPCFFVLADPRSLGEALLRHYPMEGMSPDVVAGRRLNIA
ncbi:MAG: hypothetical protein WD749_01195 [Phycisphaerales bacterium]